MERHFTPNQHKQFAPFGRGTRLPACPSCGRYFPAESVRTEILKDSGTITVCPWKGSAGYYNIDIDGETNHDAAWYYLEPKSAASEIRGRIAIWKGVQVIE